MSRFAPFRRRVSIRALAALLGLPLVASAARAEEPPATQQELFDLRDLGALIDSVYRRIPTCRHGGEATEERDGYAALARQTELSSVVATIEGEDERLLLADGQETPVLLRRLRLSGAGDFSALHSFLTRLSLRNRLVDLEGLTVSADPAAGVRFEARLALPCFEEPKEGGAAKAGGGARSGPPVVEARDRLERLYERLARLTRESNPSRVVEALAGFERRTQNRAFALTRVEVGREIELDALVFAPPARASLEADLEAVDFKVAGESMQSAGDCQRVVVRATIEAQEAPQDSAELEGVVSGNGLFDAGAPELCAGEAGPTVGRIAFRGTAPAESSLTLRLRGADLADVFLVLHDLTGQSFAVDSDVKGRADVEIERATLEQVLTAMGSAGLTVSPGRLRRVSRAGKPAAAKAARPYSGEAMDISVQNGDLLSTLCALSSVAQRPVSFPRKLQGKVNVSARDVPVDEILDTVIAAAGLVAVPEKDSLFVGTDAQAKTPAQRGAVSRCLSDDEEERPDGPGSSRLREKVEGLPSLAALGASDIELAGLVRSEGLWKAYVYAPPSRFLTRLDAGQQLFDSRVLAVGLEGVTIAGEGQVPRTLKLRP